MGKINWGRVVAGGLVAGLVLNVFDWAINGVWLMSEWTAAAQARNLPPMDGGMIVWFVLCDFLVGFFLVWLYAAIRPRYGPGPKTAIGAGLAVWGLAVFLHALGEAPVGMLPTRLYVLPGIVALFFMPLAGVAGAAVYKEEATA